LYQKTASGEAGLTTSDGLLQTVGMAHLALAAALLTPSRRSGMIRALA